MCLRFFFLLVSSTIKEIKQVIKLPDIYIKIRREAGLKLVTDIIQQNATQVPAHAFGWMKRYEFMKFYRKQLAMTLSGRKLIRHKKNIEEARDIFAEMLYQTPVSVMDWSQKFGETGKIEIDISKSNERPANNSRLKYQTLC